MLDLLKVKTPICGIYHRACEGEIPVHRCVTSGGRGRYGGESQQSGGINGGYTPCFPGKAADSVSGVK